MKIKLITAAALLVAFAIPAFAAEEFYLVPDYCNEEVLNRRGHAHGRHNEGHRRGSQDACAGRNCDEYRQELHHALTDSIRIDSCGPDWFRHRSGSFSYVKY